MFRMLLCFKLAREELFLVSRYPTTFCYRYDPKQYKSIAHTICIPTSCLEEQYQVLSKKFLKFHGEIL